MTWFLIYLVIGLAVALYVPWKQKQTANRVKDIPPEAWASMTVNERLIVGNLVNSVKTNYKTWQIVIAGLLWPTQIIAYIWAIVWTTRFR